MATTKQKKAAVKIVENHGNISKSMREAGYTDATAKNPKNLTESQGFIELLNAAGADDDKLAQVLSEGLDAKAYVKTEKVIGVGKERVKTEEIKEVADTSTRHKYLETALKVKGHMKAGDSPIINNGIALILGRYGLTNVGQATNSEGGSSQDSA